MACGCNTGRAAQLGALVRSILHGGSAMADKDTQREDRDNRIQGPTIQDTVYLEYTGTNTGSTWLRDANDQPQWKIGDNPLHKHLRVDRATADFLLTKYRDRLREIEDPAKAADRARLEQVNAGLAEVPPPALEPDTVLDPRTMTTARDLVERELTADRLHRETEAGLAVDRQTLDPLTTQERIVTAQTAALAEASTTAREGIQALADEMIEETNQAAETSDKRTRKAGAKAKGKE